VRKELWKIGPEDVLSLRGNGGQTFTAFVNDVIRAEAEHSGVDPTDVKTSIRVNIGDRGVDAEVAKPLEGHLHLAAPSCWQFKATNFSDLTEAQLRKEANKLDAKRLIASGHVYCLCVCDEWPPNKVRNLEERLERIALEINADASTPRILSASQLADWANRFTPVVLRFFRPHLAGFLSYEAWYRKERAELPKYVELPARAGLAKKILDHVTSSVPGRALLTVAGPAGSGISRLVAESLSSVATRIVYVPDESSGLHLATSLVNDEDASAILVFDRCTAATRAALDDLFRAESARLRVVAIQSRSEDLSGSALRLKTLEDADVRRVIDINFEEIPSAHQRAFVDFADGLLKIAAQLGTAYRRNPSAILLDAVAWARDELRLLERRSV
jgi:hypothetical protein